MRSLSLLVCLICSTFIIQSGVNTNAPEWGFFAHRKINRMAIFTLPQELLSLYKPNAHYISRHAVDPDKRRFILEGEPYRHYIDIDHWDTFPFLNVPRDLKSAIFKYGKYYEVQADLDTVLLDLDLEVKEVLYKDALYRERFSFSKDDFADSILNILNLEEKSYLLYKNEFIKYGILPYFLEHFYQRLVYAFEQRSLEKILKLSADIGHYIGDAHVPLHTTENYNGQLTNQIGIHAFWESRLPELFAESEYDFLVGKAKYVEDKPAFFWDIILTSHVLLEDVLAIELDLRKQYPSDQQMCYDERADNTLWIQCPEFSEAYHTRLDGMVEDQMRKSIIALGSIWYSAWVDAGQPAIELIMKDLDEEAMEKESKILDAATQNNSIFGRQH